MTRSAGPGHGRRILFERGSASLSCRFGLRPPLLVFSILALLLLPLSVRAQIAPDAQWRTMQTEHFRVTYHAGLEELAGRAAERAERAYDGLSARFIDPPSGRIDVILTDHADLSNGFANVYPSNRITIYARPPVDALALSYFDDWLELVITHELAHIFHLDRTGIPGRVVRALFGRLPGAWPVFPGRSVPTWTTEGIATFYESELSEAGRTHGTYHEMVARTAILAGTFERIDQVSGTSPVWPGPARSYIYGSLFFEHLVARYGGERMAEFVDAVAGQWVPFRLDAAARSAFGVSFTRAWDAWEAELEAEFAAEADAVARRAPITRGERLTRNGRLAQQPAVAPSGDTLAFVRQDATTDPQIRIMALDGSGSRMLTRVNGSATFSWEPDGNLVFSQVEWDGPHRIWSDLYRVEPAGRTTRLTRGGRLTHPAVHPDGGRLVAVQEGAGTNRLVEVDLESGEIRPIGEFVAHEHWAYPRWSPDGRWFAVSRWRPGARYELVVMDGEGQSHTVTSDRAVDMTTDWSPDGRWVLWSSDRTGISNLFATAIDPDTGRPGEIRQITNVLGGAFNPSVDPDGRWLVYSSYHAHGWEIERIAYDPERWFAPFETDPRFLRGGERAAARFGARIEAPSSRYSPFRSLLPTSWEPTFSQAYTLFGADLISSRYGATIGGRDLIGRHAYVANLAYAPGSRLWEGRMEYAFSGLGNPVLAVTVDQRHRSSGAALAPNEQDTLFLRARERSVSGSATFVRQRMRNVAGLTVSGRHIWQDIAVLERNLEPSPHTLQRPERRVGEGAVSLSFNNSRQRPLSISAEDGVSGFVRGRFQRELGLPGELAGVRGTDRSFNELTGTLRLYRSWAGPGFSNHVIGVRGTAGAGRGPGANAFHFEAGGAAGQAESVSGFELFGGTSLLFPVRGYARNVRHGRAAWSGTAEYRFPIALLHRGVGLVPFYLDRLSGGFFVDAGNAWGPVDPAAGFQSPKRTELWSAGAEIIASALPLWTSPVNLRLGVAFPLVDGNGPVFHLRAGRSF